MHDLGRERPIIIQVDLEGGSAAIRPVGVEVVLDELRVVDLEAVANAADRIVVFVEDDVAAIGSLAENVVDVTGVALVEPAARTRYCRIAR